MPILVAPGQAESGFLGLLLAPYRLFLVFFATRPASCAAQCGGGGGGRPGGGGGTPGGSACGLAPGGGGGGGLKE